MQTLFSQAPMGCRPASTTCGKPISCGWVLPLSAAGPRLQPRCLIVGPSYLIGPITRAPSSWARGAASFASRGVVAAAKARASGDPEAAIMSKEDQDFWAELMEQIEP